MKKIIILFTFISSLSFSVLAQNQSITTKQPPPAQAGQTVTIKNSLTSEKESYLNDLLERNRYQDFLESIRNFNIKDEEYIRYLDDKKHLGHVPLYWLMADYYAQKNNPIETHKWLYISTILTQQDSYLCYDNTAKNAPRILLNSFPKTLEITRKTPQYIQETMNDVFFFIYNLKQRINPEWVCRYGESGINYSNGAVIPKKEWEYKRQEVLKRFTDKYMQ